MAVNASPTPNPIVVERRGKGAGLRKSPLPTVPPDRPAGRGTPGCSCRRPCSSCQKGLRNSAFHSACHANITPIFCMSTPCSAEGQKRSLERRLRGIVFAHRKNTISGESQSGLRPLRAGGNPQWRSAGGMRWLKVRAKYQPSPDLDLKKLTASSLIISPSMFLTFSGAVTAVPWPSTSSV